MDASQRIAALEKARVGDVEARGMLLASFSPYVRVIVHALRDRRVQARLGDSDLMQDVFLEAHRHFASFRGSTVAELAAWLRQVAVRTTLRALRDHGETAKRALQREQSLDDLGDLLADGASSPSQRAIRDEQAARIAEALTRLPDEMQQVLLGRHVDDLPHAELARRLGKGEGAVRMLYLRALERLRDAIGDGTVAE